MKTVLALTLIAVLACCEGAVNVLRAMTVSSL